MKKQAIALFALLFLLFPLAGCQGSPLYDFDPEQVESVEVFTDSAPAQAVKKTVIGREDIQQIVEMLNGLRAIDQGDETNIPDGGMGMYFQLFFSDGSRIVVQINSDWAQSQSDETRQRLKEVPDGDALWESLDYEEILVKEEELPKI